MKTYRTSRQYPDYESRNRNFGEYSDNDTRREQSNNYRYGNTENEDWNSDFENESQTYSRNPNYNERYEGLSGRYSRNNADYNYDNDEDYYSEYENDFPESSRYQSSSNRYGNRNYGGDSDYNRNVGRQGVPGGGNQRYNDYNTGTNYANRTNRNWGTVGGEYNNPYRGYSSYNNGNRRRYERERSF